MRPGKNLERLVAALERVLAGSAATIEAPSRRLIDKDTGRRREHDVLIHRDHGHYKSITALECRDRNRPVGVPDVEAFADKCQATGVNSGIIVSASGFRESARKKAAARSITCMDLEEAESFDWLAIDSIQVRQRRFDPIAVHVMFAGGQPEALSAIFDGNGALVPEDLLTRYVRGCLHEQFAPSAELQGPVPIHLDIVTEGWTAQDPEGNSWPIDRLSVRATCVTETESLPLALHRYSNASAGYSVATATAKISGVAGKIVMVQESEGGEAVIHWVPDSPSGSA